VKVFQTITERIEEAIAKRKSVPELISRSTTAQPFMKSLRAHITAADEADVKPARSPKKVKHAHRLEVVHA
jgi:hypothetical protein